MFLYRFIKDMNIYPNLTKWENEPSVEDLKQQYESSQSDRSIHINNVSRWLDNLYVRGAAVPKTKDGRSKHVPKLIRKQAEWRYASLSEPFLSTDDVFNVSPVTAEDREGAIQNELILNYQFNNKIDKIRFIDQYVRTAVNEGTVVLRLGWEFKEEERETVEEVLEFSQPETEEELAKMVSLIELLQSGNIDTSEVPNEFMEAAKLSVAQGYPVYPRFSTHPVTRMTTVANHPTVQICHYKNITIDPTCGDDFSKASFVIYSFDTTIAELKADGRYKNLDYINVGAASAVTAANADLNTNGNSNFQFKDDVQKKLVAHEYWGYRDVYGTGKLECIVATYVGNVMIRMEVNPYPDKELPFLVIPYLPVTDSIYGEPDGELLEDNQRIIGAVTRGMVDVMGRSANGQQGTRKDALDVANRRKFMKGEDYEFNGNVDPRQAFHMHTYPEIPQSASLMLQIQHNDADSLTGVKAFSNGITGQALGSTATAVRSALDATSKRELGILRRLAEGIKKVGRKFISMNAVFLSEEEVIRVTASEFVRIRRDDLAGSYDLKLTISTAEADNQKAEELSFMAQTLGTNAGIELYKLILSDIARLRKLPDLAKKIKEYQPAEDPIAQQRAQLELALMQVEIEERRARAMMAQAEAQLAMAKAQTEGVKAGNIQSDTDLKNLNFIEQESGTKQERDLQKLGAQAKGNMGLELLKKGLETDTNSGINQGLTSI